MSKIKFKNQLGEKFYKTTPMYYYYYRSMSDSWALSTYNPKKSIDGTLSIRRYRCSIVGLYTEAALNPASALILFSMYVDKYKYELKKEGVKSFKIKK